MSETSKRLEDVQRQIKVDDWFISMREFPCTDAIGLMSPDVLDMSPLGSGHKLAMMGAFYGRNQVVIGSLSSAIGAIVGLDVQIGGTGNTTELIQIPEINGCLPPEMIGDWSFYNTRTIAWAEH